MKKRRIVFILLIGLFAVPISSVLYKSLLGFYGFKEAMYIFVLPRLLDQTGVEDLSLPPGKPVVERVADLPLLSEWSASPFTNEQGLDGVRLTLSDHETAELYVDPQPVAAIKDWLPSPGVTLLERDFGGWKGVRRDYPTDRDLLDAIVGKELPDYFSRSSWSMQIPVGYYVFPLFPPLENYQKEYSLFGVKAMESHPDLPFFRATGKSRYFFVFGSRQAVEIVFGDKATGAIAGTAILAGSNEDDETITTELIAKVCLCLDEAAAE